MDNHYSRTETPASVIDDFNNPPINTTFSKELYKRLYHYAKRKGVKEQEVIRFAVTMFLDKIEGHYNTV